MASRRRVRFLVLLVFASLYVALLVFYPKAFRLRYSRELRRDFFGLSREALREGGVLGVVRVWTQAFSALVLTAIRRRRILPMEQRVASAMVMMVQVAVIAVIVVMVSLWQAPTYKTSGYIWTTKQPGVTPADFAPSSVWLGQKPDPERRYVAKPGEAAHALKPPGRPQQVEAIRRSTHTRPVAKEVIRRLELQMKPAELLNNLAIETHEFDLGNSSRRYDKHTLVRRTYKDTDPERAQQIVDMVGQVAFENHSSIGYEKAPAPELPPDAHPLTTHPFTNGLLTLVIGLLLCLILKRREFMYMLSSRGAVREATYYLWREGYAFSLSLSQAISAKATTAVGLFVAVALSVASMVGGKGLPKEIGE